MLASETRNQSCSWQVRLAASTTGLLLLAVCASCQPVVTPTLGQRVFESPRQYIVFARDWAPEWPIYLGRTPGAWGVEIPHGQWSIDPVGEEVDYMAVAKDVAEHSGVGLSLPNNANDAALGLVLEHCDLEALDASGCQRIRNLQAIAKAPSLQRLTLPSHATQGDLAAIARGCERLREIELGRCKNVSSLECLRSLTDLRVVGCPPNMSDEELDALVDRHPMLEGLGLKSCVVIERAAGILRLPKIQYLSLPDTLSDGAQEVLLRGIGSDSVRGLWLQRRRDGGAGGEGVLNVLRRFEKLETLVLEGGWPAGQCMLLGKMLHLRSLRLIELEGTLDLRFLETLTGLRRLFLERTKVVGVAAIGELQKLDTLWLNRCNADELPEKLGALKALRVLVLGDPGCRIGDLGWIGQLGGLERLCLEGCGRVPTFAPLGRLRRLQILDVSNGGDIDCTVLGQLEGLQWLDVFRGRVDNVDALMGAKYLRHLGFSFCGGITEGSIKRVQKSLPRCEIWMDGLPLRDWTPTDRY